MSRFVAVFTRASKLMRATADAEFRRHGVRVGQNLVLEALWNEDSLTPGLIARRLGVSTPTVVKMVTRMEAEGLVTRRRDETDARLVRVSATQRGLAVRGPIEAALRRLEERAAAGLDDAQRRQFENALAMMVANLEAVAPPPEQNDGLA
jgi:DNA-binding MarR family transcriptional regulator